MIDIKNEHEIQNMRKGGKILSDVLVEVMRHVKEGVSELDIDHLAENLIAQKGGESGFKKVTGYNHTICAATNDVVVHGIPSMYTYKKGDIVCIDCGVFYNGFHTDMAETILIPGDDERENKKKRHFLETGKRALQEAIRITKSGKRVGHISKTIQNIVEREGYSVVRNLVGHGVGRELHEPPEVPGYFAGQLEKTPLLKSGMTIAIEVIYNMGGPDIAYANEDGWTIKSKDGSLSAVFERTVLVTKDGCEVLTGSLPF